MSRYPPCWSGSCEDPECCAIGKKYRWPELVGKNGQLAKMTIERENPNVLAIVLRYGEKRIENFCCNRVFVYLGSNGQVADAPMIG
ncbi:putative proteinase inhibitor I13, potato inhibitor I [Arabidopsis thaliana]|uniref:Serine protease inhibitor potato inhibitor I-type family protein n=3 Tax=Arabidopsis TaxID=3701 RepID=Q9STF8_ARATH|nr:Serine protease inhibitor, potato inhibitor I-type family protein [Arabidopsis thaliana]KAG7627578.1 Proteinase inhibitor I13 potato inhibitor I superfamily [Arabidopsis thaliana x Arabidopsis arenosa]ABE65997.1 serine protease inhibitor potato inhibitor I-type family protein [Arabidopsis thaliana]AEE78212.1 Serine protease inhibitor, potato inhibitor I-type family protein [Arabidopsis thaliana]OAP04666.1 hypothetical protein AXX17_AT3G40770 [Arabidopsis thaliana]CAA0384717.1 unnamed protei|eukprot:NP_190270.1 Serine protease inhibitor, potato inhibitor I-type family protein [Arabidopsis thaliana]